MPAAAANIRANLKTPMPQSFVNYGVVGVQRLCRLLRGDAGQAFAGVKDPALQQQFDASSAKASKAMRDLGDWLESQRGTATQDFALGADRFSRMLKATEGVDIAARSARGGRQADLERNQAALKEACAQIRAGRDDRGVRQEDEGRQARGRAGRGGAQADPELRAFVISHDLVTIPGTEEAQVEEARPTTGRTRAYIDPPGPFDKGMPSVYYISPPDPAWPQGGAGCVHAGQGRSAVHHRA